jgi:hypothetical protein
MPKPRSEAKSEATVVGAGKPSAPSDADYVVGYCRPPVEHRFKKGQSGNPNGRPKGRRNIRTEIAEICAQPVQVRDNGKIRRTTLLGAIVLTHAAQGAKGDPRSARLAFDLAKSLGVLDLEDDDASILPIAAGKRQRGDWLFSGLDPKSLSRDELIELSRIAEIVELGGDITALSTADFERAKDILNKGRGKDVTPQ